SGLVFGTTKGAVTFSELDSLLALSVAVTESSSSAVFGSSNVISNLPSSSLAFPVPITLSFSSFTVTVLPGSAVPVTRVPSLDTSRFSGFAGGVLSSALTVFGCEGLPASSLASTVNSSPLVFGGLIVTSNLPLSPAVAVPISLPFSSFTVTVLPGSALPVTCVPSSDTSRFFGLFGEVLSDAITSVVVDVLPALFVEFG